MAYFLFSTQQLLGHETQDVQRGFLTWKISIYKCLVGRGWGIAPSQGLVLCVSPYVEFLSAQGCFPSPGWNTSGAYITFG